MILPYHLAEERLTEESASAADHLGHDPARDRPVLSRQGRPGPRRPGRRPLPPRAVPRAPRPDRRLQEPPARGDAPRLRRRSTPRPSPTNTSATPSGSGRIVRDTTTWLHEAIGRGKRLLFEGAQGSLLDVDHGSYPYVTSSNSSAAGIAAGSGVPTRHIDRWIGIVKAYTTRVGGGPFPTEQDNEIGERIRRVGHEYGTVTGRPRRCGWFDAVAVRYSARVSGSTEIAVMLLDVLSGLDELKVAVAYEDEAGRTVTELPGQLADLGALPAGLRDAARLDGRPDRRPARGPTCRAEARDYVEFLATQIGVPVSIVSVGPERTQTILEGQG